jgi:hypothetical protein
MPRRSDTTHRWRGSSTPLPLAGTRRDTNPKRGCESPLLSADPVRDRPGAEPNTRTDAEARNLPGLRMFINRDLGHSENVCKLLSIHHAAMLRNPVPHADDRNLCYLGVQLRTMYPSITGLLT